MNKKKLPVLSVILYVLAGLLMIFAIWSSIKSVSYISEMIGLGQLVFSGNEYDIINFIMTSCAQYAIFAIILYTLGRIMQKSHFIVSDVSDVSDDEVIENPIESSEEITEE